MSKTFIGPKLRRLRIERGQTQAEMAKALGVSPAYVNLLENNQRSLSVKVLMAISDAYNVDWRDLTQDDSAHRLADLRNAVQDPIFGGVRPDLQELRAALDHAPVLAEKFLQLYAGHRSALEKITQFSDQGGADDLLQSSPDAAVHDYFRDRANHFPDFEDAAEADRQKASGAPETHYGDLAQRLRAEFGAAVLVRPIDEIGEALRTYDPDTRVISLSQALDGPNRAFQLAHMLCLLAHEDLLEARVQASGFVDAAAARLQVELANYYAAAYLMPYDPFLKVAERARYDIDRIATAFSVSFEQASQRLTTLQRDGARGVPFFFMRLDKAGNVVKRFNSTSFNLAEFGGSCPVWNVHMAFYTPGVILPQFVEMPDGDRFFTVSRTVHRPVFSSETQDRRLVLALGCEMSHIDRIGYASKFNLDDPELFAPIGTSCHLCPRPACSQRAHRPLFVDLPMDALRRGSTRHAS